MQSVRTVFFSFITFHHKCILTVECRHLKCKDSVPDICIRTDSSFSILFPTPLIQAQVKTRVKWGHHWIWMGVSGWRSWFKYTTWASVVVGGPCPFRWFFWSLHWAACVRGDSSSSTLTADRFDLPLCFSALIHLLASLSVIFLSGWNLSLWSYRQNAQSSLKHDIAFHKSWYAHHA